MIQHFDNACKYIQNRVEENHTYPDVIPECCLNISDKSHHPLKSNHKSNLVRNKPDLPQLKLFNLDRPKMLNIIRFHSIQGIATCIRRMNQSYSNSRVCKFVFGDGKKFQSPSDQSESSCGICVISLEGRKKYEWDINQLELSKSAERNISPYDIEPQEGAVSKINQSDSSIRINIEFGKNSLSPTVTQHKASLIPLILELIPAKLKNN